MRGVLLRAELLYCYIAVGADGTVILLYCYIVIIVILLRALWALAALAFFVALLLLRDPSYGQWHRQPECRLQVIITFLPAIIS